MNNNGKPVRLGYILTLLLIMATPVAANGERLALVIGNSRYASGALSNPENDARDIATKLRSFGFEVDLLHDASQREMDQAIHRFTRRLIGEGNIGLFYYAGHGVENQGHNFLIPVDAEIRNEMDLKYEAVDAGRVIDGMAAAGNGLNLIVLDACRNNPYSSAFRSASRGLARMIPTKGNLILYATQPGEVAQDGTGRNGVFTKHLLAAMDVPGMEVEQVFKRAALAVDRETGGSQTPWIEGVVLGRFSFGASGDVLPPESGPPPREPIPPPPKPVQAQLGHLQINVNTAARVQLDGRFVGQAAPNQPLNLSNLPVGDHQLAVTVDGYSSHEAITRINVGQWTQEVLALLPEPVPVPVSPPTYEGVAPVAHGYPTPYRHISAPSFRCSGRLQPVESIICDDPELARADGIMGGMYRDLRKTLGKADADAVRTAQRRWLKQRGRACPTSASDLRSSSRFTRKAACLRSETDRRIAELWAMLQAIERH